MNPAILFGQNKKRSSASIKTIGQTTHEGEAEERGEHTKTGRLISETRRDKWVCPNCGNSDNNTIVYDDKNQPHCLDCGDGHNDDG